MSTFTAIPVLLDTLLDNVGNGNIRLPDFQRGWVWDDDRIKGLLVSISRSFPVGAVMTLDAAGTYSSRVASSRVCLPMAAIERTNTCWTANSGLRRCTRRCGMKGLLRLVHDLVEVKSSSGGTTSTSKRR